MTFLLFAGGWTTSIDAGMAFLDWPLSNGSINPEGWSTDPAMRAEHGHRLLGMILGSLSLAAVVWTQLREKRSWVRALAIALLLLVLLQGLLGGARVVFDEQNRPEATSNVIAQTFAVLHALGAFLTVGVLLSLAAGVSRWWIERRVGLQSASSRVVSVGGFVLCGLILVQVVLGAIIRHQGVGLAIDTFPYSTSDGQWLPAFWNSAVVLNILHRLGAVLLVLMALFFLLSLWREENTRRAFGGLACLLVGLIVLQIFLGAAVVWSDLHPHAATVHHLVGALLFAVSWLLTFASLRFSFK